MDVPILSILLISGVITIATNATGSAVSGESLSSISGANHPPVISGTPPTSATIGLRYAFTPTASDRDGDRLTFVVSNRPRWASFDARTGRLAGTPTAGDVGSYPGIRIRVSDGRATRLLDDFRIVVKAAPRNRPPLISGSPSTSISEGQAYSFRPTASDPDGDTLRFSVTNRPPWATFSANTGRLSGTPGTGSVGTYSNIRIHVSDGLSQSELPEFAITVEQIAIGAVTLGWDAPTTRTDGSQLTNLAGYHVRYGSSQGNYPNAITLNNPGITSCIVENLAPGRWYFVVAAYDSAGLESPMTAPISTTIL